MTILDNHVASEQKTPVTSGLILEEKENTTPTSSANNEVTTEGNTPSKSDLETLRTILLGKEYDELIAFKKNAQNSVTYSQSIANVVSEALTIRSSNDESVATALAPTIQRALTTSIANDPKPTADALYPVMGPAIRKSISEALNQMLTTFNQLLEESFSAKSLLWRFDAWRTGRSYSEIILLKTLIYQVEEVFLINREDGLLLQHASLENIITQDSDMVSGMLTAIQDFINDSFTVEEGDNAGLNTLRLGDLTVFIEHGPNAVLAAVVRGKPPEQIRNILITTLEEIHQQHADDFKQFQGDSSLFDLSLPLLQRCLKTQKQEKKSNHLPLYIMLGLLTLGASYWAYSNYQHKQEKQQQQQHWQTIIKTLKDEPGLVVINTETGKSGYEIELLRDPMARQPSQVLAHLNTNKPLSFRTTPYLSIDDEIILLRAKQQLQAPQDITLSLNNRILAVSGNASIEWTNTLHKKWQQVTGVQQLNSQNLRSYDPRLPKILSLKQTIENSKVLFNNGESDITENNKRNIDRVTASLNALITLAKQSKKSVQLSISGHADATGNNNTNQNIIKKRIENVTKILSNKGIPYRILGHSQTIQTSLNERSVRYHVTLLDH